MTQEKSSPRRRSRGFEPGSPAADQNDVPGSGSARRFLKHLDRQLQRFGGSIDSLRARVDRTSNEEEGDPILALESLHRETRLLRTEIREHLAGGKRKSAEMMEYAEETWEQLRESFAELKENFEPKNATRVRSEGWRRSTESGEDEDEEWLDDEGLKDNGNE